MRALAFNTGASSPKSALIKSRTILVPGSTPEYTLGDSVVHNLYFVNADGTVDTTACNPANTIKLALGTPGGVPTTGTFTLTFGGQTTTALAYNATAAQVQTALRAISSIGAGNCSVQGIFPIYEVQFTGTLGLAAQALITADPTALWPASNIDIGTQQVGSGATNAIQTVALALQPVTLQTSWTPIVESTVNVGFTATIDFGTGGLAQLFPAGQKQIAPILEVKVNGNVIGSPAATIYHRVIDAVATGTSPAGGSLSGTFAIPNAADNVTVTGLTLSSAPRGVVCTVRKPAGGFNLVATVVDGSLTSTGFQVTFNGATDAANYKLDYFLIF